MLANNELLYIEDLRMAMEKRAPQIRRIGTKRTDTEGKNTLFDTETEDGAAHPLLAHHATVDLVIHDLQALAQDARHQRAFGAASDA